MDELLNEMGEQFDEDIKDETPVIKEINKDDLLKANKITDEWLEVEKAFVTGGETAKKEADEFISKTDSSKKSSEAKFENKYKSSYSSSSSSEKKEEKKSSGYTSYYSSTSSSSSSSSKTKDEIIDEKAREYTEKMMKTLIARVIKEDEEEKTFGNQWDIFELQKKQDEKRKATKAKRTPENLKKVKSKISRLNLLIQTGQIIVENLQRMILTK